MPLSEHLYKSKHFFFALIKLCVVLVAFYVIFIKLANNSDLDILEFINHVYNTDLLSFKTLLFLILLSVLNWLLEIMKWKVLVKSIKSISLYQAMQESLGALTASIITPNRIGEYAAKAIYYPSQERVRIVFLNFIGNMGQLAATLIFGVWGLFQLSNILPWSFSYSETWICFSTSVLCVIFFLVYHGKNISIKGYSISSLVMFLKNFDSTILLKSQALSILRYLVFSFQMFVLFKCFSIDYGYAELIPIITSMYVLSSILPSLFVFDVIIKGSIAVYLFGYLGISELTTLSVILLMWLFNLVLPSLIGSYFVLNFKPIEQNVCS